METTPIVQSLFERFNRWIQESITVKLVSIGFLIIILLIPTTWIREMISERQERADEVMAEVADKWSGSQTIAGPILVVPFKKQEIIDHGTNGKEIHEHIEKMFFLPNDLTIDGKIKPETLHRGIFDAVVYESDLAIKSTFDVPDFTANDIPDDMILWKDAHIIFGVNDLRGISDNPTINVGGKTYSAEPSNNIGVSIAELQVDQSASKTYSSRRNRTALSTKGIVVKLGWENASSFRKDLAINMSLKGSQNLHFVPAGKTTTVQLAGPWQDPSFDGEFLPASREITTTGFNATWKVLHFNRPFSQQWTDNEQQLSGADFGVTLLLPVDQYQKSMRTSKYGVLIILLTFVALFLVEITQKIRIHPFQYILIGAALTIYYTLLLSISEHLGYNAAYAIASAATVLLISLYSKSFLRKGRLTMLFSCLLLIFYTFIFVIILQQDYSLLLGSLGLFIIVGLLMYFSRKVNWYHEPTN